MLSLNYSLNSWKHRICSKRLTSDIFKILVGVMCNFISKLVYCNFLSSDTCRDTGNILPLFFMCLKVPEMNISSTELKKLEFEHIRIYFFFCLLFVVCSLIFIWIVNYMYKQIHNEVIDFLFIFLRHEKWKSKKQWKYFVQVYQNIIRIFWRKKLR